jgi:serine/threonine protein kinase
MSQAAMSWQGLVVNGTYPLHRYLGGSSHSAVFLTALAARQPPEVAIKLVPIDPQLTESQLSRWKTAAGLGHPHLIRLLDMGRCRLDGAPHFYAVMEYADQTLDQLLRHRALTEDEAREMLLPALDALAFLHHMDFVQGQLKPANILVVGDQLKLASDTIHRVGEDGFRETWSVYDPPEARGGHCSTAGDIWALGVTLVEALTGGQPSASDGADSVVLPCDFPTTFREIVGPCLSRKPGDRPDVARLRAWVRGEAAPAQAEVIQPATIEVPDLIVPASPLPEPPMPRPVARDAAPVQPPIREFSSLRSFLPLMLGALLLLGLSWIGIRLFGSHGNPVRTAVHSSSTASLPQAAPMPSPVPPDSAARSASSPSAGAVAATAAGRVHEEIPDVPQVARRTIRGHIKVWVRVIVEQDGSVFGALADRAGPSRYFERLAIEAAKRWTFPPSDTPARRMMQVRFDFTRSGATARAVALPNRQDARTVARRR